MWWSIRARRRGLAPGVDNRLLNPSRPAHGRFGVVSRLCGRANPNDCAGERFGVSSRFVQGSALGRRACGDARHSKRSGRGGRVWWSVRARRPGLASGADDRLVTPNRPARARFGVVCRLCGRVNPNDCAGERFGVSSRLAGGLGLRLPHARGHAGTPSAPAAHPQPARCSPSRTVTQARTSPRPCAPRASQANARAPGDRATRPSSESATRPTCASRAARRDARARPATAG